jgi:hypothetical protein
VVALNGIYFELTNGQIPRGQFMVGFVKLREFKYNHGTVYFLGGDKNNFPKLASWKEYTKNTTIKVLKKEPNNSVFTLLCTKKLVDIGLVPLSYYKYEEHADDYEDADEADDAIWSDGKDQQQQQGEYVDDSDQEQPVDEEQYLVYEEQEPVDEKKEQGDDEDNDEDTDEDMDDDDVRKPAAYE